MDYLKWLTYLDNDYAKALEVLLEHIDDRDKTWDEINDASNILKELIVNNLEEDKYEN